MASRRAGGPRRAPPDPAARLARAARQVLAWEGASRARVDVILVDGRTMRRLNRRATGRRGLTDVIAFTLPQPDGTVVGDVYICPEAARQWVARNVEDELVRLAVHGTLHVLGYDHPAGRARTRSPMWRRQERHVRRLLDGTA